MAQDKKSTSTPKGTNQDCLKEQEGRPEAINRLVEVTARRNLMALNAALNALPEVSGSSAVEAAKDIHGISQRLLTATEDFMQTLPSPRTTTH